MIRNTFSNVMIVRACVLRLFFMVAHGRWCATVFVMHVLSAAVLQELQDFENACLMQSHGPVNTIISQGLVARLHKQHAEQRGPLEHSENPGSDASDLESEGEDAPSFATPTVEHVVQDNDAREPIACHPHMMWVCRRCPRTSRFLMIPASDYRVAVEQGLRERGGPAVAS